MKQTEKKARETSDRDLAPQTFLKKSSFMPMLD
jgi:hypothetical protein